MLEAATWKGGREIAKVRREGGGRKCSEQLDRTRLTEQLPSTLLAMAPSSKRSNYYTLTAM